MTRNDNDFFTVNEFAIKIGRGEETIRRWIRQGIIYPAPQFDGYQYRIPGNARKITNFERSNPSVLLKKECGLLKRIKADGKKQKYSKQRASA
ncbi:MAG TPA: hypothetical protein DIT05_05915 [Morganella sp. (in: Bacteria)]|nr:hypothetical protein [Morganella sp. (in: enterobacteria)]